MIIKSLIPMLALTSTFSLGNNSSTNSPDTALSVCVLEPERESNREVIKNVVQLEAEAFRRLGLYAKFNYYPSKRALMQFLNQKCDFSAVRVPLPELHKEGVLRIDVPVVAPHLVVLGNEAKAGIVINKGDAYIPAIDQDGIQIAYLRNTVYIHKDVAKYKKAKLTAISKEDQGLKLLKAKRFDYFIGVMGGLRPMQKKILGLPIVGRSRMAYAYMFTHERHSQIKNKLEKVLKEMKQEDKWKAYFPS